MDRQQQALIAALQADSPAGMQTHTEENLLKYYCRRTLARVTAAVNSVNTNPHLGNQKVVDRLRAKLANKKVN